MKKYAIATVTSMGLRITPQDRMAVQNSNLFYLQATSAETNVLNVASSLGNECLAMTKFVEGSPMADFIKRQLRARNIRFEGKEVPHRAAPGATVISSTLRIPASVSERRESGMTVPAKSAEPFRPKILTLTAFSARRASPFFTFPA